MVRFSKLKLIGRTNEALVKYLPKERNGITPALIDK
jgi:hypothetical protein